MSLLIPMLRISRRLVAVPGKSLGLKQCASFYFENSRSYCRTQINHEDLPYHLVVGLPALSPTMEAGALAEWYLAEGDHFGAGDAIAKIETDKAAMDFEAQDDGFVAKILMQAGQGNEINVGTPIMITVEDAESVAAFKDYVYKAEPAVAAPPAATVSSPPPQVSQPVAPVSTPPPPPPPPTPVASIVAATITKAVSPIAVPVSNITPASSPKVFSTYWGLSVTKTSPLAKVLASEQSKYVKLYGTGGQNPIL